MSQSLRPVTLICVLAAFVLAFFIGRMTTKSHAVQAVVPHVEIEHSKKITPTQPVVISSVQTIDSDTLTAIREEVRAAIKEESRRSQAAPETQAEMEAQTKNNEDIDASEEDAVDLLTQAIDQGRWDKHSDSEFQETLSLLPRDIQHSLLSRLHVAINEQRLDVDLQ